MLKSKIFKKLLNGLFVVSIISTLSIAFTLGQSVKQTYAASPVQNIESQDERISIEATINNEKSLNGSNNGKIKVTLSVKEKTNKDVSLSYDLYKLSDDKTESILLKDKTNVFTTRIEDMSSQDAYIELENLDPGYYKVTLKGESKQEEGDVWFKEKLVFFTMNDDGMENGWSEEVPNYSSATREDGTKADVLSNPSSDDYGKENKKTNTSESTEQLDVQSLNAQTASNDQIKIIGFWKRYGRDGTEVPLEYAEVEVRYRDEFYIWRTAGKAITSYDGKWQVYITPPSSHNLWEVRVNTFTAYGKVLSEDGNFWYTYTQYTDLTTPVRNGAVEIGSWFVSKGSHTEKAFWVLDDIVKTKFELNGTPNFGNTPVVWFPSATNLAYYSPGDKIYLGANSPESQSITIHELGHATMYNTYGSYPPINCPSPHYINKTTNDTGCAWSEGWADFLQAYINNSPRFYFDSTTYVDLENTSSMDTGDMVEGRVAGALWDLYDSVNDGSDTHSYTFNNIYYAMRESKLNNFGEYWDKWKSLGYDVNAKDSLHQNTIYYN
ncbi:hypothetical protein B5G50_10715 [Brevibacillus brevis]|uniref:hypothetical protein n=1 Tax=Brevibacillus brevis TaxID=1393 RepID=UPI000B39E8F2|nr:hypothetical protein [Brevibacillus brevis]OUQ88103.1 hypothetical protein B5G50_10715 [Brevibacillus brevis]